MQSHIQTLVKHLFDKDSFDQVTVQELKQFTEAYPYAAAGHFLYAKKLYDARSWNYYEQTEQASLYFHNPLWYSWLMEQKYEAPVAAPVQTKQEEALQQQSAYRVVVQMPKGVAPIIASPPESEKEFSRLHEFDAKPDAAPIEASTEAFGDIQAAPQVEEYTEVVTDNTGAEPQPLTQEEPTTGIETLADIPAAKEEIEATPEFFAEAAQATTGDMQEIEANTVAIAEKILAGEPETGNSALNETIETPGYTETGVEGEGPVATENSEWNQGISKPIEFEGPVVTEPQEEQAPGNNEWNEFIVSPVESEASATPPPQEDGQVSDTGISVNEPSGNEEPPVHIEGDILSFAEAVLGSEGSSTGTEEQPENIPVELLTETPDAEAVHAASDLTPYQILEDAASMAGEQAGPEAGQPLQEDLTAEHNFNEPITQAYAASEIAPEQTAPGDKQPVTEEQPETVTETGPQPVTEEQPEQETEQPAETTTEQQPETAVDPKPITEEQPEKITEQPAETSLEEQPEAVTAVEPQPITEEQPEAVTEEPAETPAEVQPGTEQQPIVEEPTGPAADLQPELQAPPEPVAGHREPQQTTEEQQPEYQEPEAGSANAEGTLPEMPKLPPIPVFTPVSMEPKTAIDTEEPIFESYHTIDYFASQGIKLQQEDYKDRLGKQLKTFSEWLRSMKRIVPTEAGASLDEVTNKSIQRIAEHSVEEKEIITEAMAEVWAKQGHNEKAISVYEKLSLLNPAKSPYFAGRIEQLKAL